MWELRLANKLTPVVMPLFPDLTIFNIFYWWPLSVSVSLALSPGVSSNPWLNVFMLSNSFVQQLSTPIFMWEINTLANLWLHLFFFSSWKTAFLRPSIPCSNLNWWSSRSSVLAPPGAALPRHRGSFLFISPVFHSLFSGSCVSVFIGLLSHFVWFSCF